MDFAAPPGRSADLSTSLASNVPVLDTFDFTTSIQSPDYLLNLSAPAIYTSALSTSLTPAFSEAQLLDLDFGTTSALSPRPSNSQSSETSGLKRTSSQAKLEEKADKRHRNKIAAAKYRQKKVDRIEELEKSLDDVQSERDALKLELAKKSAEVELLRQLLAQKNSNGKEKQ